MKKLIKLVCAVALLGAMFVSCSKKQAAGASSSNASDSKKIKIGVSIWSSTDTLGSQCKRITYFLLRCKDITQRYSYAVYSRMALGYIGNVSCKFA
ncbi:MAG: hypothetical protein II077_11870, partial [Treponema sp.]|nr:hypothetical protein [Treponema sp.]